MQTQKKQYVPTGTWKSEIVKNPGSISTRAFYLD